MAKTYAHAMAQRAIQNIRRDICLASTRSTHIKLIAIVVAFLLGATDGFTQSLFSASLDGKSAIPSNDAAFTGIATLQLDGYRLSYDIQTTGPFFATLPNGSPQTPAIRVQASTGEFSLLWFFGAFGTPDFDPIVRLEGDPPPPVEYLNFFRGASTVSDSQIAELRLGSSLLTVDFGQYGSIAGRIIVVPEPSVYALAVIAATVFGWGRLRRP